jgi:RNA polymerase sigma-70 factor, ECF subfamily
VRVETTAEIGELEQHRSALTGYCYRMLGSPFEAEDAVQETLVRAWRAYDRFEGRSSVKSWLFRIATNVCTDMASGQQRRARPMDLGPASTAASPVGPPLPEPTWLLPIPDARVVPDPAEAAVARESIRLAFVAALQHLPPKQRAVLILREVLCWPAQEVAELLDTTVASVNSALQRGRATLAQVDTSASDPLDPTDEAQRELLARYVDAFERYDMDALTAVLHEDATQSMPPLNMWLRGRDEICVFMQTTGIHCLGSTLVATEANGMPAYGQYRTTGPWALHVLEVSGGCITAINTFLDVERLFPLFGLPPTRP